MKIQEPTESASRETCLGLPFVEERPISEDERAALQREARQSLGQSCVWGCLAPVVYIILITIFIVVGNIIFPTTNDASMFQVIAVAIIMICSTGLAAVFLLKANDKNKIRKIVRNDLRKSNLKCYQGFAPGIDKENIYKSEIQPEPPGQIAGVDISMFEPITLEVFSSSRRIWQVNGTRVKELICVPEEHTAFQPEQAQIAAKWVEPARIIEGGAIDISQSGQRNLSKQEADEIRRRARIAWRKPGLIALLSTVYFGAQAIRQWQLGPHANLQWSVYIFIALILWIDIRFIKTVWASWQLSKDATDGTVVITRLPDEMNGDELLRKGAVIEWLPNAKHNWTINGEPAPWRLRQ